MLATFPADVVTAAGFATTGVFDLKSLIPVDHLLIVQITSKMEILITEKVKISKFPSHEQET